MDGRAARYDSPWSSSTQSSFRRRKMAHPAYELVIVGMRDVLGDKWLVKYGLGCESK